MGVVQASVHALLAYNAVHCSCMPASTCTIDLLSACFPVSGPPAAMVYSGSDVSAMFDAADANNGDLTKEIWEAYSQ